MQILWVQDIWICGSEVIYRAALDNGLKFLFINKQAEFWSKQVVLKWRSKEISVSCSEDCAQHQGHYSHQHNRMVNLKSSPFLQDYSSATHSIHNKTIVMDYGKNEQHSSWTFCIIQLHWLLGGVTQKTGLLLRAQTHPPPLCRITNWWRATFTLYTQLPSPSHIVCGSVRYMGMRFQIIS